MSKGFVWYLAWTVVLAGALFFPVSKMIWVTSMRRLARRTGRSASEKEMNGQRQRARFIAFFLVILFAALFNYNVFGIPEFK